MKVIIEVPDKFVEISKGISLGICKTETEEQEIIEVAAKVKEIDEPIEITADDTESNELFLALALLAMAKVSKTTQKKMRGSLGERLEAMQKQAEEFQNKTN